MWTQLLIYNLVLFIMQVLDVNLRGTFLTCQAHSYHLVKHLSTTAAADGLLSGLGGSIINVSSISAKVSLLIKVKINIISFLAASVCQYLHIISVSQYYIK